MGWKIIQTRLPRENIGFSMQKGFNGRQFMLALTLNPLRISVDKLIA